MLALNLALSTTALLGVAAVRRSRPGRHAMTMTDLILRGTYLLRRHWRPISLSLVLAMAAVAAANPEIVVPWKSYFMVEPGPVVQPVSQPDPLAASWPQVLPDVSSSGTETSPPELAEAAAAASNKIIVRVAGKLEIPGLSISAPLVYVTQASEPAFQMGLAKGVVQYPGTALPGQLGNMYVFGHSSDYRWSKGSYKTVFAKLPEIKAGEKIILTDAIGVRYTYKVTGTVIARANEVKYLSQQNYKKKLLTVQTSYPVGTALKRFLAIAELVE